jgi:acyl carrier protein phosphodiesterase
LTALEVLDRIIADDRLGSYRTIEGIETSLRLLSLRLQARFGRDLQLDHGVAESVEHFSELRGDFEEFFPQLQEHIRLATSGVAPVG